MTVEIINLAAAAQPGKAHKGDGGGKAAAAGSASFDAALALRRAAGANEGSVPRANPAGAQPGHEPAAHGKGESKDEALAAQDPKIHLIALSAAKKPATAGAKAGATGTHTPVTAAGQVAPSAASAATRVGTTQVAKAGTQTAAGHAVQPAAADTPTRPGQPGSAETGARIDTPVHVRAAATPDPALPDAATKAAAAVAGTGAASRPVADASNGRTATASRERLTALAGATAKTGGAAAAAEEQATGTQSDLKASAAAGERDGVRLARHAAQPAAALPEARLQTPAAEFQSFLAPAAAHAPAAQQTLVTMGMPTAGTPAFTAQLSATLGSAGWDQALQQQSLRLSQFGNGRAELTLHPRELGQIQVSLKMGEQTQLHFASPNAQVRAAVEAALPQLRHAFAESGIDLGQASVSDQSSQPFDSQRQPQSRHTGFAGSADEAEPASMTVTTITGRTAAGGIDIFA